MVDEGQVCTVLAPRALSNFYNLLHLSHADLYYGHQNNGSKDAPKAKLELLLPQETQNRKLCQLVF